MKKNMIRLEYYYGNESDKFEFYRIPKLLVNDEYFKNVSPLAKFLYGILLDRMSLSAKNGWVDEENRVYINFTIKELMDTFKIGKNKAVQLFQELDSGTGIGLISREKQGQGKSSRIYVKVFCNPNSVENKDVTKEMAKESAREQVSLSNSGPVYKPEEFKKQTSEGLNEKPLEVCKKEPSKTDCSNTEYNYTDHNHIISMLEGKSIAEVETLLKSNIAYEDLLLTNPESIKCINELIEIIMEILFCENDYLRIAKADYPAAYVKHRMLSLRFEHIQYILHSMNSTHSKIYNIKRYMIAVLFNAPSTVNVYYDALVRHDLS